MLDGVKRIGQVFKFPNKDEIFSIARLELFKLFPQVLDFTKRRNSY
jgi:hypothetical protein